MDRRIFNNNKVFFSLLVWFSSMHHPHTFSPAALCMCSLYSGIVVSIIFFLLIIMWITNPLCDSFITYPINSRLISRSRTCTFPQKEYTNFSFSTYTAHRSAIVNISIKQYMGKMINSTVCLVSCKTFDHTLSKLCLNSIAQNAKIMHSCQTAKIINPHVMNIICWSSGNRTTDFFDLNNTNHCSIMTEHTFWCFNYHV